MKFRLMAAVLLFLLLFNNQAVCAPEDQARSLFYQGNADYSEEKFSQAIASYTAALNLGLASGQLYYNLGNAYFKNGYLGKAILNYLRAQRFIPQDADLRSNLDYARSLIKGAGPQPKTGWFRRIFFNLAGLFSLDMITLLSTGLYFVLTILLIFGLILKSPRRLITHFILGTLVLSTVSISLFTRQFYKTVLLKEAVVITESTAAKFEPFTEATTFFNLQEGENVQIITANKDWLKARRIDNKQGWVKEIDLEFVY